MNSLADANNVENEHVFINLTPLIVNACKRMFPSIQHLVRARSDEAKWFLGMFDDVDYAKTDVHEIAKFNVSFPSLA